VGLDAVDLLTGERLRLPGPGIDLPQSLSGREDDSFSIWTPGPILEWGGSARSGQSGDRSRDAAFQGDPLELQRGGEANLLAVGRPKSGSLHSLSALEAARGFV
jgi:hypothetical protein